MEATGLFLVDRRYPSISIRDTYMESLPELSSPNPQIKFGFIFGPLRSFKRSFINKAIFYEVTANNQIWVPLG